MRGKNKTPWFLRSNHSRPYDLSHMRKVLICLEGHLRISLFCRFSFHLRLWWLEGKGLTCHQQKPQRSSEKLYPIRVMCQPAGLSDKVRGQQIYRTYLFSLV